MDINDLLEKATIYNLENKIAFISLNDPDLSCETAEEIKNYIQLIVNQKFNNLKIICCCTPDNGIDLKILDDEDLKSMGLQRIKN